MKSVDFHTYISQSEVLKSRDSIGLVDVEGGNVGTHVGASGGSGSMKCYSIVSRVQGEIGDAGGGSCNVVSSGIWEEVVCASIDEGNKSSVVDIALVGGVQSDGLADGGSKERSSSGAGVRVMVELDSLVVSLSLLSSKRSQAQGLDKKRFDCCHTFC